MGSPPWLVDGFLPSAFREGVEGVVEDGESVGGYWRGEFLLRGKAGGKEAE